MLKMNVIPCFEAHSAAVRDPLAEALCAWKAVCSRAIVSVEQEDWAEDLLRVASTRAKMQIIPGIGTGGGLDPIDNVEGWQRLAAWINQMLRVTGARQYWLDAESQLKRCDPARGWGEDSYWNGSQHVDQAKLAAGLRCLPRAAQCWWWPALLGTNALQRGNALALLQTLHDALASVRIVDPSNGKPAPNWWWCTELSVMALQVCRLPTLPVAYLHFHNRSWPLAELPDVIHAAHGGELILYFGETYIVQSAATAQALANCFSAQEPAE